jgi:hypothetical protein
VASRVVRLAGRRGESGAWGALVVVTRAVNLLVPKCAPYESHIHLAVFNMGKSGDIGPECYVCATPRLGIPSQVRRSRSRPVFFLLVPPHCLKKKGTFASLH